ncbi:MAG: hypothetical protein ACRDY6_16125, partial [Acidimicrobiia bacterium]
TVQGEAMSHPFLRSVVISAAVLCLLAGCSGGGDDANAGPPQRSASETTSTTAAPATIDLSQPIPGGSLHGTPRPPLENTGDDYVAILESLITNLRWMSENPDPALLAEVFVPGTPGHDERVPGYEYLATNGYHFSDEGYHLLSVDVVDAQADLVSLRAVQQLEFERVVDSAGAQVGETLPHGSPEAFNFLLSRDGSGRWRIAGGDRVDDAEVEL